MSQTSPQEVAADSQDIARQLAEAQKGLRARDKTIVALVNRVRDRQTNNRTAFTLLSENALLQQVVGNKTLELEEKNRKIEEAHRALQQTQSQLLHAQKMESIGQLAAGVAHEINTPIQYIGDNVRFLRGSLQEIIQMLVTSRELLAAARNHTVSPELLAQAEKHLAEDGADFLIDQIPAAINESLEGVDHVAEIVRAIKEFSHPGVKEQAQLDINQAIRTTLTITRNEWKHVANVATDFAPDLPWVLCCPGQINQVLLNLIVNAAQAIADTPTVSQGGKGNIKIGTRRVEQSIEIRISDTGPGIPETIRDKIFDPFFTTKPVGKGTGQGLFIAHDVIVKKHKGTISFETELGQGTTFFICLPIAGDAKPTVTESV
jgi:signal transduction histidine kinase